MVDNPQPIRLRSALVVDDEPAMQERLRFALTAVGCANENIVLASNVAQGRERLAERAFSIALIDLGLPDGSGIELIEWLHVHQPEVPAVVVSAWRREDIILAALRAGAVGYLLKERDDLEIALALRSIEMGGAPIDPFIAKRILTLLAAPAPAVALAPTDARHFDAGNPTPTLSPRELKILELVAQGLSNREMAEQLSISKLTVECHTKNIYRKLVVGSRTEAVYQARRHGLLR